MRARLSWTVLRRGRYHKILPIGRKTGDLLMQRESRWQSCLKIDLFSANVVVEFQVLGVEQISPIAGEAGEIFKRLAG